MLSCAPCEQSFRNVRVLWRSLHPLGFDNGVFMVLVGYIDDSGEGDLFTLSCLVADSPAWVFLGFEWERCLAKTNAAHVTRAWRVMNVNGGGSTSSERPLRRLAYRMVWTFALFSTGWVTLIWLRR
jgi:hypothetical protein